MAPNNSASDTSILNGGFFQYFKSGFEELERRVRGIENTQAAAKAENTTKVELTCKPNSTALRDLAKVCSSLHTNFKLLDQRVTDIATHTPYNGNGKSNSTSKTTASNNEQVQQTLGKLTQHMVDTDAQVGRSYMVYAALLGALISALTSGIVAAVIAVYFK